MKYVITGGAGHISKPLAEKLLAAGHEVTMVGRSAENLKELVAKGASQAIGSVEDISFLKKAFDGADAVYTMVPPNLRATDWKNFIGQIGKNYAEAIASAGIKYVVNLSSVGAHLSDGVGPVSGLYRAEKALNSLSTAHIKHLRPSYFYDNLYSNIGLIKNSGIMGGNFNIPEKKFPIVAPADIAAAAAEELIRLDFTGQSVRYIVSDETGTGEIASLVGNAIGKPELPWVPFTDEQALQGMLQAGLPEEISKNYVEMGNAMNSGKMFEDYFTHKSGLGAVKLNDFVKSFAVAYEA